VRRLILAVVALLGLIGGVVAAGSRPQAASPFFTQLAPPGPPFVPTGNFVTSTWYCPGTPARGSDGTSRFGGEVVVTNPTDAPISGRLRLVSVDQAPVMQPVSVGAHQRQVFAVDELVTSTFASAIVELDGGRGIVEQKAIQAGIEAVASCSNATSSDWYFADGFTIDGDTENLILTNPFPGTAIVDVTFALEAGSREPSALQGLVVPGNSVLVRDLGAEGAQQQSLLAVHVQATFGRVVAGKEQRFQGGSGGRLGYVLALGAPSLDSQWWFADGERGTNITEHYVIYNPSDEEVEADIVLLGIDPNLVPDPSATTQTVRIGPRDVTSFAVSDLPGVPEGRHSAVVSTAGTQPVVVERVLSRPVGENQVPNTTVVMGQPSTYLASTWHVPIGVTFEIDDALVVYNTSFSAATVTVSVFGPGGAQPIPGLTDLPIAASGLLPISLQDAAAFDAPLVVTATSRVVVERRLARGGEGVRGRTGSFAIPEF
jgi:uncharacterized protein DUF5719